MMGSSYSVFYHEHVLDKEPGMKRKPLYFCTRKVLDKKPGVGKPGVGKPFCFCSRKVVNFNSHPAVSVSFLRLRKGTQLSTFLSPNNHLILVLKLLVEKMNGHFFVNQELRRKPLGTRTSLTTLSTVVAWLVLPCNSTPLILNFTFTFISHLLDLLDLTLHVEN